MDWKDGALAMAGIVGGGTALVHGLLVQRLMVRPIGTWAAVDGRMSAPIRRLVPALLHFSTAAWLLCGLALIAAAIGLAGDARPAIGLIVGSLYLFGAAANLWATRGRHPGWMLMAVAVALILVGVV